MYSTLYFSMSIEAMTLGEICDAHIGSEFAYDFQRIRSFSGYLAIGLNLLDN